MSYASSYQNVTGRKFFFEDGREKSEEKRMIKPMHIESGFNPTIVDMVLAMNHKIRKRIDSNIIFKITISSFRLDFTSGCS